ncbi:MAG: pyrroline-5-carboxylate reductase [Candidatus Kerfeldbacteria bacterium]|nr:pyrroline-5-carboxylate reductase [Candidatus Kerfeldbacteria bacterium]
MRHLTIFGAGTIGGAIARALTDTGFIREDSLTLVEKRPERVENLQRQFPSADIQSEYPDDVRDVVFLTVKPQDAGELLKALNGRVDEQALVVSGMAGVLLEDLQRGLGHVRVVRVMTNTPLVVRQAFSVWIAGSGIREEEKRFVRDLLSVLGKEEEVTDENLLDVATAVSGSGPAYFFTFFQALVDAAESLGLSRVQAEQWVRWTALGAVHLWEDEKGDLQDMIQRVMSRGGTTEAALKDLPHDELHRMWKEAMCRAYARVQELSRGQS